jgi:hypothetical protein
MNRRAKLCFAPANRRFALLRILGGLAKRDMRVALRVRRVIQPALLESSGTRRAGHADARSRRHGTGHRGEWGEDPLVREVDGELGRGQNTVLATPVAVWHSKRRDEL